jgi:hypothetical protein
VTAITAGRRVLYLLLATVACAIAFDLLARPYAVDTGPSIVNLQLSFSSGVFTQIIGLWQREYPSAVARVAWTVATLDMIFPVIYAAFLGRLYVWLRTTAGDRANRHLARLPWIAAGFDYLENVILLGLLWTFPAVSAAAVTIMSMAAALKFACLTISIACSAAALLGGERGRVLRTARYSMISLLVATVPLIYLPQGRDLLVSLTDSAAGAYPFSFLAWLTVWAFSVWYSSRILLEAQRGPSPARLFKTWARWTPRIAGALTLLLPGLACLLATDRTANNDAALYALGVTCMLMSALFLWFTIRRRQWLKKTGRRFVRGYSLDQLPSGTIVVLAAATVTSLSLFLWLVLDPLWAGPALGSVTVLVIAAANTVFIGSVVVFTGRWLQIPIEPVAFVCAAVFSLWNDNHGVRLLDTAAPIARPTIASAFDAWLAPLEAAAPPAAVPVIVVATEGGGIRAAYWTATVLTEIDRQVPGFGRHLFAVSSVSGGSIGAAVYAGLQHDTAAGRRTELARQILSGGFLAPITARLVTGDFLQWFIPFPIAAWDRARAMESSLEAAYERATGRPTFSNGFLALPQGTAGVPLLFVNATSVDTGRRAVTSAVTWSPPDETRRADLVDVHSVVGADLRVSTTVHNSSRFPYISPAGRVRSVTGEDRGHVVDGGYFENTGADTLVDVIGALRAAGRAGRVRIIAVILRNTPEAEGMAAEGAASWKESRRLGEAFAPLRALLRSREARGELAVRRLRDAVGDDVIEFSVCAEKPGEAEPPLGWELSREMIGRLDMQLESCTRTPLNRLRQVLGTITP